MKTVDAPIIHFNRRNFRSLDLRPFGIGCIPILGFSSFVSVRQSYEFHRHPGCMEFCLCLKGNLVFDTNSGERPFRPGLIFASSPSQPHRIRSIPKGTTLNYLLFAIPKSGESILGLDAAESRWLSHSLTHLPNRVFAATDQVKELFKLLFTLHDGSKRRTAAQRTRMKTAAQELLVALVDAARRPPAKIPDTIRAIAERIQRNPESSYPVPQMARDANLSLSAFSDIFKRSTGLPPHAYQTNARINRAKELLTGTSRSIASIANELNFASKPHFASMFERIVGLTPSAYRRMARCA